jgi:hypothetical protein
MVVQTNPISGSRPGRPWYSWALAPMLRDALRRHCEQDFCAKQTQFPPLCRSGDRRSQGPIVRNKPNSGGSDFEDKCCSDKELRRIECGKSLGKTKPISRGRQWVGADKGSMPSAGPVVQTNPICRQGQRSAWAGKVFGGGVAGARYAKQTQFARRSRIPTTPVCYGSSAPSFHSGTIVRNKANFPARPGGSESEGTSGVARCTNASSD